MTVPIQKLNQYDYANAHIGARARSEKLLRSSDPGERRKGELIDVILREMQRDLEKAYRVRTGENIPDPRPDVYGYPEWPGSDHQTQFEREQAERISRGQ